MTEQQNKDNSELSLQTMLEPQVLLDSVMYIRDWS